MDEGERETAELLMQDDSIQAGRDLSTIVEEFSAPAQSERAQELKKTESLNKWASEISKQLAAFEKMKLPISKEINFEYDVSKESLEGMYDSLMQIVSVHGGDFGENSPESVSNLIRTQYWNANMSHILRSFAEKVRSNVNEETAKRLFNPSALTKRDGGPTVPVEESKRGPDLGDGIADIEGLF